MNHRTPAVLCAVAHLVLAQHLLAQQDKPAPAPAAAAAPAQSTATPAATRPDPAALIGKTPPPITVAKWVKGQPLTGFEPGKVYVVDFWATWCGPCKAAIPHLTKLQKDHAGKVEVIGVSISERQTNTEDTAYIDVVQKFVDKQGDKMDYRVAVDTPDKKMHTTWFKPTGTGGIPTAYIIDQKGLVVWTGIGSPKTLERIVEEVLAGTFDPKAEAERVRKEEAEAKQRAEKDIAAARAGAKNTDEKFPGYREAMDRGDRTAALEALNAAFKADPAAESGGAYQWKYNLLMQANKPAEVEAYARDLLTRFPDNNAVHDFSAAIIAPMSEETPRFDSKLALELAQRSVDKSKPDSRWQQYAYWRLGWAKYHNGDKAGAAKEMQTALDNIARLKSTIDFGELESSVAEALKTIKKP